MKRLLCVMMIWSVLLAGTVTVCAQEVPELDRSGSIQVEMRYAGKPVSGGTWMLYRVGEIQEEDGNYGFALTGEFAQWDGTLENVQNGELAQKLKAYAMSQNLIGTSQPVGQDGKVRFENVQTGLYLLVQYQAAEGYDEVSPFLISVPVREEGTYQYDVDASPKVALTPAPTEPQPTESVPTEPSLPQTGQLNWPIPVLTVAGLSLFAMGWGLFRHQKRSDHEA